MSEEARPTQRIRLPNGWRQLPLKRVVHTFSGAGFPIDQQGLTLEEIPFHKVGSLSGADQDGWIHGSEDTISRTTAANLRAPLLDPGTIVIAKIGAALLLGRIRQLALRSTIDNNMLGIVASGSHARFLYFALQTVNFAALVNPGAVPSLSDRNLRMWPIMLPPVEEQRRIAEYLDRETGQIDALITKQEQLVETLTERRQAVIAQAVTRGLSPTVELKDPELPWFGTIPAHWLTPKVNMHFEVTLGKMLDVKRRSQTDDLVRPYIRAGNIQEAELQIQDLNEMAFSPQEVQSLSLQSGDLLVVEGGAVGVNQWLSVDLPEISFQKTVNRVRSRGQISTRYLGFILDVLRYRGVIDMICNKSTIAHLTADKLQRIVIPHPPVEEQAAIVAHVLAETTRIDALVDKALQVIDVLKERRQALISAAVTGKIDVRNMRVRA